MTKAQLLEQRGDKLKAADTLVTTAQDESRSMTAEEVTQFDTLEAEAKAIGETIERMERTAGRQNVRQVSVNQNGEAGEKEAIKKRFSITKALRSQMPNAKPLGGLELEMHQQAEEEARSFKANIEGVGVPEMLFSVANANKRELTVGVNTQIGNTVATDMGGMIPYLQPRLQAQALGATVLSGLTSNVDFPRNDAIAAAVWEGEVDESAETNPTTDQVSVAPNRLSGTTKYSKQLLLQSSISVDDFVGRQLTRAIEIGLDLAALNGSGTGNQPTGILNTTGIGDVAMGTNGGAVTRAKIIDLVTKVATANADMGKLSFLTTPGMRGKLQQTFLDAGSGRFVWGEKANELVGYNAQVSTQVPSNLVKGSSGANCHAIIYGNWEELLMTQWGGLDLVVDPYSDARNARVVVTAHSWWDIALTHPAAFAAILDGLIA